MIEINPTLSIPRHELRFEATTSSGPGGQHVNRSRTRITLLFDVEASTALSPDQKRRVWTKLATRIDRVGRVRVRCGRHRSQAMNREETIRRFAAPTQTPPEGQTQTLRDKTRASGTEFG